ncbi:MAG: hypothetical protein JO144_05440, partial [Actinobacteria bacterium]|nr:hypothetical protein [Actinomycetota bacterium]
MTPDELDAAIRQELQFAARLAPEPGPVRRRVLLAAEALEENPLPARGLRAWTVPLLAAAAAVLVALGLAAATTVLRADRSPAPPAGSPSPAPATPEPTGSSKPAAPSSTVKPSSTASPSSPTSTAGAGGVVSQNSGSRHDGGGTASPPAGGNPPTRIPTDWFRGLNVAALPHTAGLCPGTVDHVSGMGAPSVSVP